MGFEKIKRPVKSPRFVSFVAGSSSTAPFIGKQDPTVSVTSTATILPAVGTASLAMAAAGDGTFRLATPAAGGRVHVTAVDSTHAHTVRTKTTAETFFGSTFNTLAWSTALAYRAATFEVVGSSTSLKWHVVSKSTGAVLA